MTQTLQDIAWLDPLIPPVADSALSARVKKVFGQDIVSLHCAAASPWVSDAMIQGSQIRAHHISSRLQTLVHLVASQENSCRFCYGNARSSLRITGMSESELEAVEREVQMSGADANEHAILQFARNLSRSTPRPARAEFEALLARGLTEPEMLEVASVIGTICFLNRVATFLAVPLDAGMAEMAENPIKRLFGKLYMAFYPRPLGPIEPLAKDAPLGDIVGLIAGTDGALVMGNAVRGMLASNVFPTRT
jgi:alkylhydroperoxidase family enzyme